MSAPLTIQVRLGFSMGWRIWTPNEVRFYTKTLAHSYFIYNIVRSKLLSAKIWIINYSILMNISKYSIFIEYLRFGLKHKEEGLRWTKMTYLSLALASPRGQFVKKSMQKYHRNYVVKYSKAKARRENRRKRQGRFFSNLRGWRVNRKSLRGRLGKRASLLAALKNYHSGLTLPASAQSKRSRSVKKRRVTRKALREMKLKTIVSRFKVSFRNTRAIVYKSRDGIYMQQIRFTSASKLSRYTFSTQPRTGPTGTLRISRFNIPQLLNKTINKYGNSNIAEIIQEGQAKCRQADYRAAKRVRAIRKSSYKNYLQLLKIRKKFSNRELDTLQRIKPNEILIGAKFLFFFYGGLYPGAFRKLRRSFTSKNVLKLKHLVWFWQKLALMVSFYVNKVVRNNFVWKMSHYGHKTLKLN